MAAEQDCDFGGIAFPEVVTVNGLSIPMNDSKWSVLSCSIVQEVTEDGMVNNTTNFLSCCMGMALTDSHLLISMKFGVGDREGSRDKEKERKKA